MYFKRNESYRFAFGRDVAGRLTKIEKNDKVTTDVQVLDVSNKGAKLYCQNPLSLTKDTKISLAFHLNATPFQAMGAIVWIKKFPRSTELGVHLNTDDEYKESMIRELKQIAKQEKQNQ
ncbi:PilZ domain-containing protein [Lentibacillus salicampi]|uniref:PilZ domain-containing protein n=1 Tax=Lentibacillus salicampi TaxID=175306 RepID=A0A4Y9AGC8_9BACI|nr:PilZ domain-containing protein [Lentibacillus salicampi]TFJ94485.1 PilZ domain-containing protein [Lentibacillus salicampi]